MDNQRAVEGSEGQIYPLPQKGLTCFRPRSPLRRSNRYRRLSHFWQPVLTAKRIHSLSCLLDGPRTIVSISAEVGIKRRALVEWLIQAEEMGYVRRGPRQAHGRNTYVLELDGHRVVNRWFRIKLPRDGITTAAGSSCGRVARTYSTVVRKARALGWGGKQTWFRLRQVGLVPFLRAFTIIEQRKTVNNPGGFLNVCTMSRKKKDRYANGRGWKPGEAPWERWYHEHYGRARDLREQLEAQYVAPRVVA